MPEANVTVDTTGRIIEVQANTVVDRQHELAVQVMPDPHPNEGSPQQPDNIVVDKDHELAVQTLPIEPHAALTHLAETPMEALARWERDGYPTGPGQEVHTTPAAEAAHEDRLAGIEAQDGTGHPETPESAPPADPAPEIPAA